MKYYQILVHPKFKNKHQKRADFKKFIINNEELNLSNILLKFPDFPKNSKEIEQVILKINDAAKNNSSPYPDFISVLGPFFALNQKAISFLKKNHIPHYIFNTFIANDDYKYFFVCFEDVLKFDINKSQIELKGNKLITKGKSYFDSPLIVKEYGNFSGMGCIDFFPNILICNEMFKEKLEQEKLTGFYFKEIQAT